MKHVRALAIVLTAVIVDVWLAYSGPGAVDSLSLFVLLGVLTSLALFFDGILRAALPNPATRAAALLAVVLLGVHPSNADLLRSPGDVRPLLGLLGVALGLALYQHKFAGWLGWVYLAPVAAAALCDRVALSFVLLLLAYKLLFEESPSWKSVPRILAQCIPAALLSLLVLVIPGAAGSATGWEPGSAIGALLTFVNPDYAPADPFPSALALAILAALVGIAAWAGRRPTTRPLAFGIAWFVIMLFAAPNQFLCAYAGLALVAGWAVAEILTLVRGPRRWLVTASCALLLAACGSSTTQKNDASKAASAAAESGGSSADTLVSPAMTAQQWLALSLYAYNHKRFLESLAAAQTALKLQPNYPEAENNVAAAYSALHQWDLSIGAAQEALRLKPDFPLARNNLNWAMEQKRLGAH